MRVIHKKISLNEFRSRTCGKGSVIMDAWTVTDPCGIVSAPYSSYTDALDAAFGMNLNEASISYSATTDDVDDIAQYNYCNYGMIPVSGGTIPEMSIDIMLTTSIDDLGQMSIISEDYREGVDYGMVANTEGGSTMGYESYSTTGAVVNMVHTYVSADTLSDDIKYYGLDTYILDDPNGSSVRDKDTGYILSGDGWSSYTDRYVGEIADRLYNESVESGYTTQIHEFSACCGDACKTQVTDSENVNIISGDVFVINDAIYPVRKGIVKVECMSAITYTPLLKDGNIEYFIYYGKRQIVSSDSTSGKIGCDECIYEISGNSQYIVYNNSITDVYNDTVTFSSDTINHVYEMVNGYFTFNGVQLYIKDGVVVEPYITSNDSTVAHSFKAYEPLDDMEVTLNGSTVSFSRTRNVNYSIVSGYCDSKLQLLRRTEITVDELGNELPGYFDNSGSTYNNPYIWCELEPLYMVGNVSELMATGEENHYIGNIISGINKSDDVWEITYYLGADIEYNKDSGFTYNSGGVKYVDTINVEYSAVTDYHMADGSSFPVYYTKFGTNLQSIHNDDYDSDINMNMAYFEYTPECYSERRDYMVAPVYRNEFDLTTSLPQNIEGDIYIDRGISSAFERHLKLQEIRSMTSLENYGNAWFKINDF